MVSGGWEKTSTARAFSAIKTLGEGEMYAENNMETYITICKIDSQWEFAVWLRKLKQGLCINLEGGRGSEMGGRFKREGIYVYLCLIHVEA